ncbi:MAG: AEC family transporter [Thioalkalivibrionaceae bacterium]
MVSVVAQMAVLIAAGIGWRWFSPGEIDPQTLRRALTTLVYYLLLPALVLKTIWLAPLGADSLRIALVAALTVLGSLAIALAVCRLCRLDAAGVGALLMAAAWPNATYLGLPVLDALFGLEGRAVAIQYDLFACLPLLLILSVWIGRRYGVVTDADARLRLPISVVRGLLRVPALWAALGGVALNLGGVPLPDGPAEVLGFLGHSVAPLMLFALGLALTFEVFRRPETTTLTRPLVMVVMIQLAAAPLIAWLLTRSIGLEGVPAAGSVLEAAMPAMVLGLVFCDRYRLDASLYAAAVTTTTLAAFLTLPAWFWLITEGPLALA